MPKEYSNLLNLAHTPITAAIDEHELAVAITSPPFIPLASALNLRDIGSLERSTVRPALCYRSGTLHKMKPDDLAFLRDVCQIHTIFDLRVEKERLRDPSPEVTGVTTVWVPPEVPPQQIDPADFVANDGLDGFMKIYGDVLRVQGAIFKLVFEFIRDNPRRPFLFHCTAGKDRTGVLAALLFNLTDCPVHVIAEDYMLTRLGTERDRELLIKNLKAWLGENAYDQPGVLQLGSVNMKTMEEFNKSLNLQYGDGKRNGARGWLQGELDFSPEEVDQIVKNISVEIIPKALVEIPSSKLDFEF
ncbi:hypothetical protein BT63DRAFT_366642 [Microthyrium microscopicum]|uniref:Tyrosine specific protein phosphatases domain-containing protein n=1 Tax=Microthyrium microscopicum TaxID=703497 RepID=A0A6A6URS8_9PEZI|nr:hypothetical protein BT63DRAFT_366642 [Microthyrium microscopicum]